MTDIHETLTERGARYGKFREHAWIAQNLQDVLREGAIDKWQFMKHDVRQALTTICDKMARIVNGNPEYDDNWRDIAGYATLVLDRILEDMAAESK